MLQRLSGLWTGAGEVPVYSKIAEDESRRFSQDSTAQQGQYLLDRIRTLRRYLIFTLCLCALLFFMLGAHVVFVSRTSWVTTGPVPQMPKKTVKFEKSELYSALSTTESDQAWAALVPSGRGFISIDDSDKYGLPPGLPVKQTQSDLYNIATFHQLYCLTTIREYLWQFKFAVDHNQTEQLRPLQMEKQEGHVLECFDYLRQALMCAGDMTLEHPNTESDVRTKVVDGWGVSHQCVDWDAILHYTDTNTPSQL